MPGQASGCRWAWSVLLFVAFVLTTPQGGLQYAFPVLAVIVIYVFSFDQGRISVLLRSRPLARLGLWSYSIYMAHIFVFRSRRWRSPISAKNPSRACRPAQQRETGVAGNAGTGGVVRAPVVCRARRAGCGADLALDREAGAGCGEARGVDCLLARSRAVWRQQTCSGDGVGEWRSLAESNRSLHRERVAS
jgi:hypothetical protein